MGSAFQELPLQKWIWIELTGFDNEAPDLGVESFYQRAGFRPEGFSLLLYWVGFVHSHMGMAEEKTLCMAEASYGGHEYAPERRRQDWTNWQLRDLVAALHARGAKVYLSYFNMSMYADDEGCMVIHPFFREHNGLLETNRKGQLAGGIHMLKRLADGTFYEDVLQEGTVRTLVDYGFDGVQIADGISSPRVALEQGDYSADMLEQFEAHTGIRIPLGVSAAEWIWAQCRAQWIAFHTWRWEIFYQKFARRLKQAGKEAIFNSAWTRDPLEAMYRYGVDYRRVAGTGIEACMVEDVSPTLAILSEQDNLYLMNDDQRKRVHYVFLTALMLNRAAMPCLRITPLSSIHDTMEQWGVLEHMPTALVRNVFCNLNTFVRTADGMKPVTDGPFFCLSDGLTAENWRFIRAQWEIGYTRHAGSVSGPTLIWSDAKLDGELAAFTERRWTPTHQLVSELLYAGAPIAAIARVEDIASLDGALLVTHPALLPWQEWEALKRYAGGPVFCLGEMAPEGCETLVEEHNAFAPMVLSVFGQDSGESPVIVENSAQYHFDSRNALEKANSLWTHPLCFAPISEDFYRACADRLTDETQAPRVTLRSTSEDEHHLRACKCVCVYTGANSAKVIVTNDEYFYNIPQIDLRRQIRAIRCLTKYAGYKVRFDGSVFTARVPGRGAEAFEVEFVEKEEK